MKRICPICNSEFETARPHKIYCSLTCREAGRLMRRAAWKQANPGYQAEYMRAYRKRGDKPHEETVRL